MNACNQVIRLVKLDQFEPTFQFDIRYARIDNFMNRVVYESAHAFLLEHVAHDLRRAHDQLATHGFGLLIFDGYRPWSVTKLFWDLSKENDRKFLADPELGSSHNRACAVDLSLYDLKTLKPVTMPSDFDEMNEKSFLTYSGGDAKSRELRDLLQATLCANQFKGIKNEWWHFNHLSHEEWPVMNFTFNEILKGAPQVL